MIVPDVSLFPDHIACDKRSKSEIVIPIRENQKYITGVFDMDSNQLNAFDLNDLEGLERIIGLLKF